MRFKQTVYTRIHDTMIVIVNRTEAFFLENETNRRLSAHKKNEYIHCA